MIIRFFYIIKKVTLQRLVSTAYSKMRVIKYWLLSDCKRIYGKAILNSPVLMNGLGIIEIGENVNLGIKSSPSFYNTYIYIEARSKQAAITIKKGVWINNNAIIISEGPGIIIGENSLIGHNFTAYDTDFHCLHPNKRITGVPLKGKVIIESNVFIGSNVTILKGVTIGENSIIASGSIVTKSIPSNVIAGGNPC